MGSSFAKLDMTNFDCATERKRFKTFLLFTIAISLVNLGIAVFLRILFSLPDESIVIWMTVPYWLSVVTVILGFVIIYTLKPYTIKSGEDQFVTKKGRNRLNYNAEALANENIQRLYTAQNVFIADMIFVGVQGITLFSIFLYRAVTLGAYHGGNVNNHYLPDHSWRFGNCLGDQQSCTVTEVVLTILDGVQSCVDLSVLVWGLVFYVARRGFQINCKEIPRIQESGKNGNLANTYESTLDNSEFSGPLLNGETKFASQHMPEILIETPKEPEKYNPPDLRLVTSKSQALPNETTSLLSRENELRSRIIHAESNLISDNSITLGSGLVLRTNTED